MPLSLGRYHAPQELVAYVDDEDYERVSALKWRLFYGNQQKMYAANGDGTLMHRVIAGTPTGMQTDHRNGNGLDNRRSNLRIATHSQNLANQPSRLVRKGRPTQSKFKGVTHLEGRLRPWRATISVHRKQHFLGYHPNEVDAARAYDAAARLYFGEFAHTNFGVEE